MKTCIYPILAALALTLTGCISGPITSQLSESHPAHPQAPQSPDTIANPRLMAGSQGLVLPVSTNQTEMQRGQHQQTPPVKGAQKPAEHKHEHNHK